MKLPTRRDLLKAGLATGMAPLARAAAALAPQDGSFTFVYMSDTHVSLTRNIEECRAMFAEMAAQIKPDFVINGGDVTEYGWKGEYENYSKLLTEVTCNVHHVPGNHDVRWSPLGMKVYSEHLGPPFSSFRHQGCLFVLLDSSVPLSHWGHFESAQLRWLESLLKAEGRQTPVFVVTHHWVGRDAVMTDNEEALRKILEPYNVKLLLNGHGHSDLLWTWDGIINTMNKGLYQGSYQKIDVDRQAGLVRLSRRTTQRPEQRLIATVPLAADRLKRRVWRMPAEWVRNEGESLPLVLGSGAQHRWNEGAWSELGSNISTKGLAPGSHLLSLRNPDGSSQAGTRVKVRSPGSPLRERWSARLSGGVMSHLALDDERLYVSTMNGFLTALRPDDGRLAWDRKVGAGYCHSSPSLIGDLVVVGNSDGSVAAFDRKRGDLRWRYQTGGPIYASASAARGVVAIASGDGAIYGLDEATGRERWRFTLPAGNSAFAQSPAATDGARFFVGAWDTFVYALDAETGAQVWRKPGTDKSFAYSPAIGGPAAAGGRVFVPANGNQLWCFDAATGETVWVAASPGDKFGYSGPAVLSDRLVIGCLGDKGEFRCLSLADGKEIWCCTSGAVIYDSSPAAGDGFAAIGSVNGLLTAADLRSGAIIGQYRLPTGHMLASPVCRGREIYAASYSDQVVALELRAAS